MRWSKRAKLVLKLSRIGKVNNHQIEHENRALRPIFLSAVLAYLIVQGSVAVVPE